MPQQPISQMQQQYDFLNANKCMNKALSDSMEDYENDDEDMAPNEGMEFINSMNNNNNNDIKFMKTGKI